jgi:chromosome segregation ATPase
MSEKAELNDEVQRLEHLVMQLELETDTIGEYISLYHHQRDQLKAKFEHKDQEIAALTADKTRIQGQVRELQRLMSSLVHERQALQEQLNSQSSLANQVIIPQTQNGSEDSESSSEEEEHPLKEEIGHVTMPATPVDSRERQIFEILQELGRSSRSSGNVCTYDPSVGRVSFFPFTGSCGKEVLVL